MISTLILLLSVSVGIQSEGGYISQLDINYSQDIYISGNLTEIIQVNGQTLFITIEIPPHVQNPFIKDNFLYYEIV